MGILESGFNIQSWLQYYNEFKMADLQKGVKMIIFAQKQGQLSKIRLKTHFYT